MDSMANSAKVISKGVLVVGQALITAVIAEVEFLGLRRSTLVESYARH